MTVSAVKFVCANTNLLTYLLFCFLIIVFLSSCFDASVLCILCSVGIVSLLLVIMGGQHDGLLLSGSSPILYIHIHIIFCSWQINSAADAVPYRIVQVLTHGE